MILNDWQNDDGKITSFNNSLNFKKNELYKQKPDSIQIVLYTDGFDTANPLGDQRNSNKVNSTYFRIGNLDKFYQSVNHLTQVAILCTHDQIKEFGYERIHEPLLNDIKILEQKGI